MGSNRFGSGVLFNNSNVRKFSGNIPMTSSFKTEAPIHYDRDEELKEIERIKSEIKGMIGKD